jgi:outer membrane biosynthesis protein TonB
MAKVREKKSTTCVLQRDENGSWTEVPNTHAPGAAEAQKGAVDLASVNPGNIYCVANLWPPVQAQEIRTVKLINPDSGEDDNGEEVPTSEPVVATAPTPPVSATPEPTPAPVAEAPQPTVIPADETKTEAATEAPQPTVLATDEKNGEDDGGFANIFEEGNDEDNKDDADLVAVVDGEDAPPSLFD